MNTEEIDALREKAKEARVLGDKARKQGHLDDAEVHFKAAYEIDLELQKKVGDTPEVLRALVIDLQRYGDLVHSQGYVDVAERCYPSAISYLALRSSVNVREKW